MQSNKGKSSLPSNTPLANPPAHHNAVTPSHSGNVQPPILASRGRGGRSSAPRGKGRGVGRGSHPDHTQPPTAAAGQQTPTAAGQQFTTAAAQQCTAAAVQEPFGAAAGGQQPPVQLSFAAADAQGSVIEEIQHFWNEAERVASLFDNQVGVQPQHEEIIVTQPEVDMTLDLESQSATQVANSRPTPKRTKKSSTVATTSNHPRTRSRTTLKCQFSNTIDKPLNLD
nr:salivary glue protein Sgs-3-like [Ipomoea batatas]